MSFASEPERAPEGAQAGPPSLNGGGRALVPAAHAGAGALRRLDPLADSLQRPGSALALPAVQTAAVAAGGFAAGVAVAGLARRRRRRAMKPAGRRLRGGRGLARTRRKGRAAPSPGELVQIVASRSLLVDVHLLGNR